MLWILNRDKESDMLKSLLILVSAMRASNSNSALSIAKEAIFSWNNIGILCAISLLSILASGTLIACKSADSKDAEIADQHDHNSEQSGTAIQEETPIRCAADRTALWIDGTQGKRIGLIVNHSSRIASTHLVDSLISLGLDVVKVFAPEHGFRGDAANGELIEDDRDPKTGVPLISLYGKDKKPSSEMLSDLDLVIFDIQDVGARFYTYISTMSLAMEACAEEGVEFWVLDRPNPHGRWVDGPMRKDGFESFVSMHPIPILHGMSVGELASMIQGQGWIKSAAELELKVFPCEHWSHQDAYTLPIAPSPNLPNQQSVLLYPSLCLFEGTVVSIGRGTAFPFQVYGHPDLPRSGFVFKPRANKASKYPKHEGENCFGTDLRDLKFEGGFELSFLLEAYQQLGMDADFFNRPDFFDLLAGSSSLREQILEGKSESEIRASWADDLAKFKEMRKEYLIY
jgi:uncharacterized protein YbbC (DUF1343 family)